MTTHPINLTDWQVRAALDGRLSLVVEPIKGIGDLDVVTKDYGRGGGWHVTDSRGGWQSEVAIRRATGDRLWVREAHYMTDNGESEYAVFTEDKSSVEEHLEDMQTLLSCHPQIDWSRHLRIRSSTQLPRWASRLTLVVTDVRVMRVQEINLEDAIDSACRPFWDEENPVEVPCPNGETMMMLELRDPTKDFQRKWNARHAKRGLGWDANPWVTATSVTVHRCNIDQMEGA